METPSQNNAGSFRGAKPAPAGGPTPEPQAAAAPATTAMSVIGADILVTGNIEAEVDLLIEGRVLGDVRCATLILGEKSSIKGKVLADRVRVSGSVEGAVETTDLAIEASARVKGDVTFSRLRVANGGVIEGTMKHVPPEENAPEESRLKLVEAPPPKAKEHYFE